MRPEDFGELLVGLFVLSTMVAVTILLWRWAL